MKIGLLFGSFNPVHIGHLIVADALLEAVAFDRVWFVVSPLNPFKDAAGLANETDRLKMVQLAVADHERLTASDIEFDLPRPSYTVNTLQVLRDRFPHDDFSIILGADNLAGFTGWKDWNLLLERTHLEVYDRNTDLEIPEDLRHHPSIHFHHLPLINISSTLLRRKRAEGKSIRYWVLPPVEQYIVERGLYRSVER